MLHVACCIFGCFYLIIKHLQIINKNLRASEVEIWRFQFFFVSLQVR